MIVVISFEYFSSPILYGEGYFNAIVSDFRMIKELIDNGIEVAFLEEEIALKMHEFGFFPSNRFYQKAISQMSCEPLYSANDISKLVNNIIQGMGEVDCNLFNHLSEWDSDITLSPNLAFLSKGRGTSLRKDYASYAIEDKYFGKKFVPLHVNDDFPGGVTELKVEGILGYLEPSPPHALPYKFEGTINVLSSINNVFVKMDGYDLYLNSNNDIDFKLSFYVGAINLIDKLKLNKEISWDDFDIGRGFTRSLHGNECSREGRFSSVTYEFIIHLLIGTDNCEYDFFYKRDSNTEPRTLGELTAYRAQLTKSGRALRLLFWINPNEDKIILANIGNKMDLEIAPP